MRQKEYLLPSHRRNASGATPPLASLPPLERFTVPTLDGTHAMIAGLYLVVALDAPAESERELVARWAVMQRTPEHAELVVPVVMMPELTGPAVALLEGVLYVRPAATKGATTRRIREALRRLEARAVLA